MESSPLVNGFYYIRIQHTNKALDIEGGSSQPNARLIQYTFHGGDNQIFFIRKSSKGFEIIPKHSKVPLGPKDLKDSKGNTIVQVKGTFHWQITEQVNKYYSIWSPTNKLYWSIDNASESDLAGINLQQFSNSFNRHQLFGFTLIKSADSFQTSSENVKTLKTDLLEGDYHMRAKHSGKYLGPLKKAKSGVKVVQSDGIKNSQVVTISKQSDGYYTITQKESGLCWEVKDASKQECAEIIFAQYEGKDNQKWKFWKFEDCYFIQAKHSDYVLDVYGGETGSGARLIQYPRKENMTQCDNQLFGLTQMFMNTEFNVPNGFYTITARQGRLGIDDKLVYIGDSKIDYLNDIFYIERMDDGYYRILCKSDGRVLEAVEGKNIEEREIKKDYPNNLATQAWMIRQRNWGCVEISNKATGGVMSIYQKKGEQFASVLQQEIYGDNSQLSIIFVETKLPIISSGLCYIKALHSSKLLDIRGGSINTGVDLIQYAPHYGSNQTFYAQKSDEGDIFFYAMHSGQPLNVDNYGRVVQGNEEKGLKEPFEIQIDSKLGGHRIVSRKSQKCLQVENNSTADCASFVMASPSSDGKGQLYYVSLLLQEAEELDEKDVEFGYYCLKNKESGEYMDIMHESMKDCASLIQYPLHGGNNQVFLIEKMNDGYRIVAKHSCKVLDVYGGGTNQGCHIIQYQYHGGSNQLWEFQEVAPGWVRILSLKSRKCLQVYPGGEESGICIMNLKGANEAGVDSQLWALEKK